MDGLSAAASGIAVVSLAIQLVDSVRQIQRFLRNISEAPKELRRLINLLEQLELILESIGELIDRQQRQSANEDVAVSDTVLRAMKTCENTVKGLAGIVDVARKSAEAKNKATKTLGSLRLSCKKKDIEEFERQLHEAVSLLNLTMTMNLTAQVMATNQITTTISQEMILLRNSSQGSFSQNCHEAIADIGVCTKNRGKTRSRAPNRQSSWFQTPLGRVVIRKESSTVTFKSAERGLSMKSYTRDESTWIFMSSFFSRCIDFRYLNSCGYIQRSLRTYPVVRNDHPVWWMCLIGDVIGIQKLFSERQLSPFSVDSWGDSLLDRSVLWCRWEVCKLLFQVGLTHRGQDTCRYNPLFFRTIHTEEHADAFEKTCYLLASHVDDIDPSFFARGFFCSLRFCPSLPLYYKIVDQWIGKENVNVLFSRWRISPIPMALRTLRVSNPADQKLWKQAIQNFLSLGLDLHTTCHYEDGNIVTLLDDVLNIAEQPFESHWLGQKWLEILSESGIDVVEYLGVESEIHFDSSQTLPMMLRRCFVSGRERYLIISKKPPTVSWEWYIDPAGSAFDVLQEFMYFGGTYDDWRFPNCDWELPFFYPAWHYTARAFQRGMRLNSDEESYLRIFNNRCERREQKKAKKLAREQGLLQRGPKVPGAWID
ncbi:hypothetical protein F5882DRAFT_509214 [Hyaloscypha sp. PMI_1271]|nr:hypothetical protein F5882DRAFT_509214 [Hyaloscypha sp. PMI_1271]